MLNLGDLHESTLFLRGPCGPVAIEMPQDLVAVPAVLVFTNWEGRGSTLNRLPQASFLNHCLSDALDQLRLHSRIWKISGRGNRD